MLIKADLQIILLFIRQYKKIKKFNSFFLILV